jgi:acyl-CoA thioester hydrolase
VNSYTKPVEIRWSDLDPNFHVRHSVYYDMGAYVRMSFLTEFGLAAPVMIQHNLGPILFREECLFKREIHFGDIVTINLLLKQCSPTYSRWTMQHEVIKNGNLVSAIITVDGAWIDTVKRRLTVPTDFVASTFEKLPRATDFSWIERKGG